MTMMLNERLARIRLLAMDVDGVLTDGTIVYDTQGGEQKRFHVADGLGLVLLRLQGVEVAWITGRSSTLVERRSRELGITQVIQGVRDKGVSLQQCCDELRVAAAEVAYIGDDWNDLPAFTLSGVRIAVANAATEIKERADVVTLRMGGQGAVREVCDMLLEARGERESCMQAYLQSLKKPVNREHSGQ